MADLARVKAMKAVEAIFERFHLLVKSRNYNGFDQDIMSSLKLISASPEGSAVFEFDISERYGNMNGVMHGGAAALIFDMCTTSALGPVARPGHWDFLGGVSRTLNISYLKAIPIGTTVRINCKVLQVGRTMAMMRGEITSLDGKVSYSVCEHHKVSVPTPQGNLTHKIAWDEEWERETKAKAKAKI